MEKIVTIISAEGLWAARVNAKAPPGQFGIEIDPVACLALLHDAGADERVSRVVGLVAGEDISAVEDAPNFLGYLHAGEDITIYKAKAADFLAEHFGIRIDEQGVSHRTDESETPAPVPESPPEGAPEPPKARKRRNGEKEESDV